MRRLVALLAVARALVAPPPRRTRILTARAAGSPLDGFANALKGAFANDETLAPAAAKPAAGPDVGVEGDWRVELRLVGVPQRDPSNDLFGPRMRITDDERGLSAQEVVCTVRLAGGAATVTDADAPLFTDEAGKYRCEAGVLKVRLFSAGFTRTFTTTGSLQSIYGGESTSRTSSVYAIAPGPLLLTGDAETLPSTGETFVRKGKVFCLEKTGLFGSAEKVSPAGTFTATTKPLGRTGGDGASGA